MTYAFGWALQQGIFAALGANADLAELVGGRIHDEPPHRAALAEEAAQAPYLLIGEEAVAPWDTATERGAAHELSISAVSSEPGFATVKRIAAAVCDAMEGSIPLARGRVAAVRFLGARTARGRRGPARKIEMRFRVIVEDEV